MFQAEAERIGLNLDQAQRLAALAGAAPPRLGEPGGRAAPLPPLDGAAVLGVVDDLDAEAGGAGAADTQAAKLDDRLPSLLERIVDQQAPARKARGDPMSLPLSGGQQDVDFDSQAKMFGARGCAVRELVREGLAVHPLQGVEVVDRDLANLAHLDDLKKLHDRTLCTHVETPAPKRPPKKDGKGKGKGQQAEEGV